MENAGAITFRDNILLLDASRASADQRRLLVEVIAHEISHMWFGDLVTMEWWDDLWLNESFAQWMGDKVTNEVYPEYKMPIEELDATHQAYEIDDHLSTRAMRQKVDEKVNLNQL